MSHHSRDHIFALDIGTRSVVGLLVHFEGESFTVIDCEISEHDKRSMLDGQIHDVGAVSQVISTVKNRLSERNGKLKKVAVAAAGRSLKTKRICLEQPITEQTLLTKDDVMSLELAAIQEAQKQLANEQSEADLTRYYCVGYSVVNYFLDGQLIGSLVDQRGSLVKVDIIATFLPRVVVDSLVTALNRAGLVMNTLTLEPIAAINVLIPATMRKLNIALVDIGAGTSDIAITEEGTVTAYGMVPVAGDEITEAISQSYLLDFPIAEQVKRNMSVQEIVHFCDILGMEHHLTERDIVAAIETDIEKLSEEITRKILAINGKTPQAVMLIGGGSLTPTLPEKIAARLNLPATRVAVRSTDAINHFIKHDDQLDGPEFITPVGIAVAARNHPVKYLTVNINGENIHIFDLKKICVGDVLLHAGFDMKKLYGKPGLAMSIEVNGSTKFIPGEHGQPPILLLNSKPTHLDSIVHDYDLLQATAGRDGKAASPKVRDVIDVISTLDVYINNTLYSIAPIILINGKPGQIDTDLQDRDSVFIRLPRTLAEVLDAAGQAQQMHASKIDYFINNQKKTITLSETHFLINSNPAGLSSPVQQGERIDIRHTEKSVPEILSVLPCEQNTISMEVLFNGRPIKIPLTQQEISVNECPLEEGQKVKQGDKIVIKTNPVIAPIFSDVFRFTEIQLNKPEQANLIKTFLNGEPAQFNTPLNHGDKLELRWE